MSFNSIESINVCNVIIAPIPKPMRKIFNQRYHLGKDNFIIFYLSIHYREGTQIPANYLLSL